MQDCDVSLLVKASETAAAKVPGTILVVIGESETRDHMKVFNRNHLTDTTPWEAKAAAEGDIVLFGKAYSNYPNTPMALTQALTGVIIPHVQITSSGVQSTLSALESI